MRLCCTAKTRFHLTGDTDTGVTMKSNTSQARKTEVQGKKDWDEKKLKRGSSHSPRAYRLFVIAGTHIEPTKFCSLQILFPSGELVSLSELLVLVFLFGQLKRSPLYRISRNKIRISGARRNTSSHVESSTQSRLWH